MPAQGAGDTYFTVLESRVGCSVAQAYYSHRIGSDIEFCEVVAVIDQNQHLIDLRKLPLKKTDIDVPQVTDWTLLDLADKRGDGQEDVILVGERLSGSLARSHQRAERLRRDNLFWPWLLLVSAPPKSHFDFSRVIRRSTVLSGSINVPSILSPSILRAMTPLGSSPVRVCFLLS